MIIAATIGHAGRPSRWADRGAAFEGAEEVSAVRRYLDACDQELRRLGHTVVLLSDGEYSAQWTRADQYQAGVYLNCHVNAGGGDRGELFYDHRSTRGQALAESVAAELGKLVPWGCRARACRPDTNGIPRDSDYSEAFGCISGVKAVALCVEPYFIDGPRRAWFLANLNLIGQGLARGVNAWSRL